MAGKKGEKRAAVAEVITRETTIHLHKNIHGRYVFSPSSYHSG